MKKALSFAVTAFFIFSSLGLASCSDKPSNENGTIKGTTTGGLDIGIASGAERTDTAATDADTLGTATE